MSPSLTDEETAESGHFTPVCSFILATTSSTVLPLLPLPAAAEFHLLLRRDPRLDVGARHQQEGQQGQEVCQSGHELAHSTPECLVLSVQIEN